MSEVLSLIWLRHKAEPAMPRFRLSAVVPLGAGEAEKLRVILWLDEVSLKLIEAGPFERAGER